MTTYNMVTVTATFDSGETAFPAEADYTFTPRGTQFDVADDRLIVPRVQKGRADPVTGVMSVQLVASDNFAAGVLTWHVYVQIRGAEPVEFTGPVLHTAGATQDLFTLATANGWSAQSLP